MDHQTRNVFLTLIITVSLTILFSVIALSGASCEKKRYELRPNYKEVWITIKGNANISDPDTVIVK